MNPQAASRMVLTRRSVLAGGGLLAVAATLAACSNSDPFSSGGADGDSTIVVGSQQYYSNEIIAELYAQALENAGFTVDRQYQIGQREVYLPELESGAIDVLPEYGGNLLQYYDSETEATDADSVHAALPKVLPETLMVLDYAAATDQDSYTVTRALADEHGLVAIGDLAKLGGTVMVAANSEFKTRPYGPTGIKAVYGVDADVYPVEDSGGSLTVGALSDGTVQVADIYTSSPAIDANDLVVLEDPESLILPQNVTPLVSAGLDAGAVTAINAVSALLTTEALRSLNARSVDEQLDSATIATDWLTEQGILSA
ncbi:osmoprotectant transport system substrate-binding protein [Actinomyces ruminicola]|uniref:Osmoprotectant transport system substrate-binding protein n=1 Tax=Actinomyces ruminicola TaxID=332524 RepID=A0A1H0F4P5_9ACTO|nr:ABC transporter substrate-binding protein [Actinomyces ruminicola]SDN89526.1 osmoprotectant transport system substrate-binding protein [Actinomyces ruminicola]